MIVNFDVVFPRRLTRRQKEALRSVMDDDDIEVLEDVIRLAKVAEDARDWEVEQLYSLRCRHQVNKCTYDPAAWLFNVDSSL